MLFSLSVLELCFELLVDHELNLLRLRLDHFLALFDVEVVFRFKLQKSVQGFGAKFVPVYFRLAVC